MAIWGKKKSSKFGKFAAFVVWLSQTDSHAGKKKRLLFKRPLQLSDTFLRASSTSTLHIILFFRISINTNLLDKFAQEKMIVTYHFGSIWYG
jgi:hypothetical protein